MGEGEAGTERESSIDIYTLPNVKWMARGKLLHSTEINSILCEDLEGWDRKGGREAQEGGHMGIYVCV